MKTLAKSSDCFWSSGDTIRVKKAGLPGAITVRLACMDAPELAQNHWGKLARPYLQMRLPIGMPVTLVVKATDLFAPPWPR